MTEAQPITTTKQTPFLIVLSLAAACIALLATGSYGVGISNDSVGLITAARHIAAGLGVSNENGDALTSWPPLYPTVLAIVKIVTDIDPLTSVRAVNAVLFGLSIYLSGLLFLKHLKQSSIYALAGTTFLLISAPLVETTLWALSESLFIVLVLLHLITIERYLANASAASLVLLSTLTAMAFLTRYVGIILVFTCATSIFFFSNSDIKTRIRHLFVFSLLSGLPIGLWIARNYYLAGTFFGLRASSSFDLTDNLYYAAKTIQYWYLPERVTYHKAIVLLVMATIIALSLALLKNSTWTSIKAFLIDTRSLLLFIISYLAFLIYSSSTVAYDQIASRLLCPIYIPVAILTLLFIFHSHQLLITISKKIISRKIVNVALVSTLSIWMLYPALLTLILLKESMSDGKGYNNVLWQNSQTIKYLQNNQSLESRCTFYSNMPELVFYRANIKNKKSPQKTWYNSTDIFQTLDDLQGSWPKESSACLVWFKDITSKSLFSLSELKSIAELDPIANFQDSTIYTIRRK